MKRLLFACLLLLLLGALTAGAAQAQTAAVTRHATVVDLTVGVGPLQNSVSAAAWRLWGLDPAGRYQVGLGARTSYFYEGGEYDGQTAPADYRLSVFDSWIVALNVAMHLRARIAGPVDVGFNLDLAGVSFGPASPAVAKNPAFPNAYKLNATALPVRTNLLRGGAHDRGSLNSELYAVVFLPHGLGLRAGYSHVVTASQSDYPPDYNGPYHHLSNLATVGLSLPLR